MILDPRTLTFDTHWKRELIDITQKVETFVQEGKAEHGLCVITVPHATAALIVNENEKGLRSDILNKMEELFPNSQDYEHNRIDNNADAHLAASFLGHSAVFPIQHHKLVRGTWQNIFLVELDGPRERRNVHLQIIGEA